MKLTFLYQYKQKQNKGDQVYFNLVHGPTLEHRSGWYEH
jgi:hypothetical protein